MALVAVAVALRVEVAHNAGQGVPHGRAVRKEARAPGGCKQIAQMSRMCLPDFHCGPEKTAVNAWDDSAPAECERLQQPAYASALARRTRHAFKMQASHSFNGHCLACSDQVSGFPAGAVASVMHKLLPCLHSCYRSA